MKMDSLSEHRQAYVSSQFRSILEFFLVWGNLFPDAIDLPEFSTFRSVQSVCYKCEVKVLGKHKITWKLASIFRFQASRDSRMNHGNCLSVLVELSHLHSFFAGITEAFSRCSCRNNRSVLRKSCEIHAWFPRDWIRYWLGANGSLLRD